MLTDKEIQAIALVLQDKTPVGRLSNMEVRTVLEFMDGLGYLAKPAAVTSAKAAG